jgi:hypothetical protein
MSQREPVVAKISPGPMLAGSTLKSFWLAKPSQHESAPFFLGAIFLTAFVVWRVAPKWLH